MRARENERPVIVVHTHTHIFREREDKYTGGSKEMEAVRRKHRVELVGWCLDGDYDEIN